MAREGGSAVVIAEREGNGTVAGEKGRVIDGEGRQVVQVCDQADGWSIQCDYRETHYDIDSALSCID